MCDRPGSETEQFRRKNLNVLSPPVPLLEYLLQPAETAWLRASLTTFASSVASIVPGRFEAFARIYHPFHHGKSMVFWRDLPDRAGMDLPDPATAAELAMYGSIAQSPGRSRIAPLLTDFATYQPVFHFVRTRHMEYFDEIP
jgi:hypothetical protein